MGLEIINLDFSIEMYYICIMKKTNEIKFRKNDNNKWCVIIRGGRSEQTFKTVKIYNRQRSKQITYDD